MLDILFPSVRLRGLLHATFIVMVACVATCCHRVSDTEARLIAIDSLVCDQPDSALSLLAGINGDSLRGEERAYHALLTVQALYKAYIPATSDTLIRRAWDYYRDRGSYDRRIRAMLYMGTVAEELGHPDSAMRWYKRTELESRPDDHYHRGYALMAMAYLYRTVDMSLPDAIDKYREALSNFEQNNKCDTSSYMFCIMQLGTSYRTINSDSAYFYLSEAIKLCDQFNFQSTKQDVLIGLAGYYYSQEDFNNTIIHAKKAVQSNNLNDSQLLEGCYYISLSFSELGNVDSAKYYFNLMPKCVDSLDSIKYLSAKAEIENLIGHHNNYLYLSAQSDSIADTWLISSQNNGLKHIELAISKEINSRQTSSYLLQNNKYKIIISLLVAIIVVLIFFNSNSKQKREIKALSDLVKQLEWQKMEAEQANHTDDEILRKIGLQSYCVNELFKGVVYSGKRGASIFKLLFEGKSKKESGIISVKVPDDFWSKLGEYVDAAYPNAFENMKKAGIELTEKEANIISLDCLQIPNAVIEHILGYGERSLAPIKSKLISEIGEGETDIIKILQKYSDQ